MFVWCISLTSQATTRLLFHVSEPELQARFKAYPADGTRPLKSRLTVAVEAWLKSAHGDRWTAARGTDHWMVGWPVPYGGRQSSMNLIGPEMADPFEAPFAFRPERFFRGTLDVVTPYADPLAVESYTDDFFATHPRDKLVLFAGNVNAGRDPAHWRRQMRALFAAADDPRVVWIEMDNRYELGGDLYEMIGRSEFGIVLEGDSVTSRRLFTLVFAGAIPVILVDGASARTMARLTA